MLSDVCFLGNIILILSGISEAASFGLCESLFRLIRCLFLRQTLLTLSDFSEATSSALISQLVCHNCLVPGFTDGAGFLLCDIVVKTENLDWIFHLDVLFLLRLTLWGIGAVEYLGLF